MYRRAGAALRSVLTITVPVARAATITMLPAAACAVTITVLVAACTDGGAGRLPVTVAAHSGPGRPAAAVAARTGRASQPRAVRIMPLGDSITWGATCGTRAGYRVGLWRRIAAGPATRVDFVGSVRGGRMPDADNEGHPGWRIDQIAAHIDGWLARYRPDVVLLHIGTNDLARDWATGSAPERLAALVDRIAVDDPSATVLVASLIPSRDPEVQRRIDAFNAAVPGIVARRAARGGRVRYVAMTGLNPAADLTDRLHPNDRGYDRMAARWYAALLPLLPSR